MNDKVKTELKAFGWEVWAASEKFIIWGVIFFVIFLGIRLGRY